MEEKAPKKNQLSFGKVVLGFIAVVVVVIVICVIKDNSAKKEVESHRGQEWDVISETDYVRDGRKCKGYRVYVDRKYGTNSIYSDIFQIVTDDGYYMHTVWIYNIKSAANGSFSADYIMEQTRQGELPDPVRQ